MEKVLIEVKPWEARLARSPVYWIVAALTGVFFTFVPFSLYQAGKDGAALTNPYVLSLFITIYLVSYFYITFGIKVAHKLRETKNT